jgi:hypothetical protein
VQYADVNGDRCEATPHAQGTCPLCESDVVAKCGQIVVHHWAHVSGSECDPWWEPETEWHRHWKSFAAQTEVSIQNHRADIVTSTGLVVELQHSGISVDEIHERERCYGDRLRWLFDGTDIPVSAPDGSYLSRDTSLADIQEDWETRVDESGCECLWPPIRVRSQHYGLTKEYFDGDDWSVYTSARLNLRRKRSATPRSWEVVTFRWRQPRKHYASPSRPVYIDLPGNFILKLGKLHLESGAPYGGWGWLVPRKTVEGWLR